jgi:hypothetical protein
MPDSTMTNRKQYEALRVDSDVRPLNGTRTLAYGVGRIVVARSTTIGENI